MKGLIIKINFIDDIETEEINFVLSKIESILDERNEVNDHEIYTPENE
jgi:hypothetical protein